LGLRPHGSFVYRLTQLVKASLKDVNLECGL
jgi:hypothetical protein